MFSCCSLNPAATRWKHRKKVLLQQHCLYSLSNHHLCFKFQRNVLLLSAVTGVTRLSSQQCVNVSALIYLTNRLKKKKISHLPKTIFYTITFFYENVLRIHHNLQRIYILYFQYVINKNRHRSTPIIKRLFSKSSGTQKIEEYAIQLSNHSCFVAYKNYLSITSN